jgi:acyl transferase domain-containing protein
MKSVALFPGQGAYIPGVFTHITPTAAISELLGVIDDTARQYGVEPLSPLLWDPTAPSIEELVHDSYRLNLVLYAASQVLLELLGTGRRHFDVLVGHSGGEITALAASGALTVPDAIRVIYERTRALVEAQLPEAGMLAMEASASRTAELISDITEGHPSIAAHNAPRQTVVSGTVEALVQLEAKARELGLRTSRLATPHPFHNPMLAEAGRRFTEAIADVELREPQQRVYSPILQRDITDLVLARQLLSVHFTAPVKFVEAMRSLHDEGAEEFVECGAGQALAGLVQQCLPATVHAVAPLARRADASRIIEMATGNLAVDVSGMAGGWPDDSAPADAPASASAVPHRAAVLSELRQIFAEVVGYPVEVFTDDAELEAELGISSVRRLEGFARILKRYGLPAPSKEVRIRSYRTLPQLADLVQEIAGVRQ